jgi:elongation factor G
MRLYSGSLDSGADLYNAQTSEHERLNQFFVIQGKERHPVLKLHAGDIGALVKLKNTHTNNTLHLKGSDVVIAPIAFPDTRFREAVRSVNTGDEEKMAQGLHQLIEEDPSLLLVQDASLNQMLLGGLGDMHLSIVAFQLKNRFGVDIEYYKPRISYRETVTTRGDAQYRHKKQTGGAGQFADITMYVEPIDGPFEPPRDIKVRNTVENETSWGAQIEFIDAIVGGVIDMRRFFGAIQKGINEVLQAGPLAKCPVNGLRVIIYDGGMHPVDSNDNAFKTAAFMGFRRAFEAAKPVLLEPIHEVEVTVPESYMGDVLGDMNTRRARIQGMEAEGIFQKIKAHIPEAELYHYSTTLRSLTQGRGLHTSRFYTYEPVPRSIQEEIIAETRRSEEG